MSTFLVISDSHIDPSCPNVNEWKQLGEYCVSHQPDYIIHLGDVANLNSLAWLKAARGELTTEQELAVVSEHLEAFENVIKAYNNKRRRDKKKLYRPKKVLTLGNHDVRNGNTGIEELFDSHRWDVHDYLDWVRIEDITFCHCMHKGLSDNVCTTAQELLENWHGSIVVGHGHCQDFATSYSVADDKPLIALKSPVFNSYDTGWAVQTRDKWSRGFTWIDNSKGQPFEFTWKDMSCLSETC